MNTDLITILSDHINNRTTADTVPVQELIDLAQAHQVVPIVYYQTKNQNLYQSYLQAISVYTKRTILLGQISDALCGIPFYTVKGMSISRYYPIPQLRTMSDCDIVVRECDKEMAKERLLSVGFRYAETKWDSTELHFQKHGLDFELHHRLLYDELVNTEQEKSFADTVWDHVRNHEPEDDFHFVFTLIHLKKHLLNSGVGIRQFLDLAVMSQNAQLDPGTISVYLKQVGLEKFAGVCAALCRRWFSVDLPVEASEVDEAFYTQATEMILSNGVFGFENPENRKKGVLNSVEKEGKFGSVIHKFFPSYRGCAGTVKYRWVKGRPYLMPLLWLSRPFEFLFSGRIGEGFTHIASVTGSDRAMEERSRMLSEWGL